MVRFVILLFAIILLLLLAYISRRRTTESPLTLPDDLSAAISALALRTPSTRFAVLKRPRRLIPLLQSIAHSKASWSTVTLLQEHHRALCLLLMQLEQDLRQHRRFPADESGHPRMLLLARELVRHNVVGNADDLLSALDIWHADASTTHAERMALPLCVRLATAEQLHTILLELRHDLQQAQQGHKLALRLPKNKRPERVFNTVLPTPAFTDALVHCLRLSEQSELLSAFEAHLRIQGLSLAELTAVHARNQAHQAEQLLECFQRLRTLSHLNWAETCEESDPLHQLLQEDPSAVYPRMTLHSRIHYRKQAAALARLFRVEESRLMRTILSLCRIPDQDEMLNHPGWYLLEDKGIRALHKQLNTHRGTLRLTLRRWRNILLYAAMFPIGVLLGLMLLKRGYTLWVLPPLLMTLHSGVRFPLHRLFPLPEAFVPEMQFDHIPNDARTLVITPAVLCSRSDAIPTVRRMLLSSHTVPAGAADFFLLADYADSLTATSGEDSTIVYAAKKAVDALNQTETSQRFLYFQRSRSYNKMLHRYTGREGLSGALGSLCQLITNGRCPDTFDEATTSPESLHRRYAYVLVVPPDTTLAPDALLHMLGALEHPLNRLKVSIAAPVCTSDPDSLRTPLGLMFTRHPLPSMCCLLEPRVLSAAAEKNDSEFTPFPAGEFAGHIRVPQAHAYPSMPATLFALLQAACHHTSQLWQQVSWILPWRNAEHGVKASPLSRAGRRRLRMLLYSALLPAAQLIAIFCAALLRDGLFVLLFLLAPHMDRLNYLNRHSLLGLLKDCCLMPVHAAAQLYGALRGLWLCLTKREFPYASFDTLPMLENWSQTLCALGLATASLNRGSLCLPALVLAAGFGCFPFIHNYLDKSLHHPMSITDETDSSLMDIAHATWRYFSEAVTEQTHYLPPEGIQLKPWRGISTRFRPDDAGLYLLCCLCACELDIISADTAAQRITQTLETLEKLPMWHALPFDCYDLSTLSPESTRVDTQRSGILCAGLLCAAQGIRALLPQLDPAHLELPARLDALAHAMNLADLYDPVAQLFFAGIHADTGEPETTYHQLYASPALLASFCGVMLGQLPYTHFDVLDRTRVRIGRCTALCSPTGSMEDYLLPLILLPLTPVTDYARTIRTVIRAQRSYTRRGMFGYSPCAVWQFDRLMNYVRVPSGLPELSLHPVQRAEAVAPYAAALCLPFDLPNAHTCLMHLRSHGMLGRLGFFDSLDMDKARLNNSADTQAVQCHFSAHQAMLLCSLCNALTDNHLPRTLAAIPSAAACSLLLRTKRPEGLVLTNAVLHSPSPTEKEPPFRRAGILHSLPVDAHVIGTDEASLVLSVQGSGIMRCRGLNLTRFTGLPGEIEGLQFYLSDGTRTLRLGDPQLETEVLFSEGYIRITQRTEDLHCILTAMVDPASGTFLHTLEILNLTGHERFLEAATCLVPDFSTSPMRAANPSDRVLTITSTDQQHMLCHVLTTADPLIALHSHTDFDTFAGDGDLRLPSGLTSPAEDLFTPSPHSPCMGFRARLSLGIRGRATLVFTTRLLRPGESFSLESLTPRATDLPGALTLSRLCCRAVLDMLDMTQAQALTASRIGGIMLWRNQPHQGPVAPLTKPFSALSNADLDPTLPLMTLMLYTPEGLPLLQEAANAIAWLNLSGQSAALCVLCMGSEAQRTLDLCRRTLAASPAKAYVHLLLTSTLPDGLRETIEAASRLLLYEGAGTLDDHLDALAQPFAPAPAELYPDPGIPPDEKLLFPCDGSGWQEQTADYVLRLAPGTRPPNWDNILPCGDLVVHHTPAGPGKLLHEGTEILSPVDIRLITPAGCIAFPGIDLPRRVQFSPSMTRWQAFANDYEMELTSAPFPGHSAVLHTLRLKNHTGRQWTFDLVIAASFSPQAYLSVLPHGIAAVSPCTPALTCLTLSEGEPAIRRMSEASWKGESALPAGLNAPDEDTGSTGVISLPLTLSALGTISVTWIAGMFSAADELELLLNRLRHEGASPLMRSVRQSISQQLGLLTLSTPDPALNLLMNQLLPHQLRLNPHKDVLAALLSIPALCITAPPEARELLLHCIASQFDDGDMPVSLLTAEPSRMPGLRLLLVIQTCSYVSITGDTAILQKQCSFQNSSSTAVHGHLMRALTSIRLGKRGLPLSESGVLPGQIAYPHSESVWLGQMFAYALACCAPLSPADDRADIEEVLAHLINSLDKAGWDGSWYLRSFTAAGTPAGSAQNSTCRIDALTQSWAAIALGLNQRTLQAVESAWQHLWDASTGHLHCIAPPYDASADASSPTLLAPGYGPNGGQDTFTTLSLLRALCLCSQHWLEDWKGD